MNHTKPRKVDKLMPLKLVNPLIPRNVGNIMPLMLTRTQPRKRNKSMPVRLVNPLQLVNPLSLCSTVLFGPGS